MAAHRLYPCPAHGVNTKFKSLLQNDLTASDDLDDFHLAGVLQPANGPVGTPDHAAVDLDSHTILGQTELPHQIGCGRTNSDPKRLPIEPDFHFADGG